MKILIDTHIFLWSMLTPDKLRKATLRILSDPENEKFLSAASTWEIAIKYAKGSLILPSHPKTCVPLGIAAADIIPLPIKFQDTFAVADLPPIHRDPFDRLIITQAKLNGLKLLTDDPVFKKYGVDVIGI